MTTPAQALLTLYTASQACQAAHDALVEAGCTAAAREVHIAGERVAMAIGLLAKEQAEQQRSVTQ